MNGVLRYLNRLKIIRLRCRSLGTFVICSLICLALQQAIAQAQTATRNCYKFNETGRTVCDKFLRYWSEHGGLPQQGYPISDELREVSEADGRTYTVQYFERAVFELHDEYVPPNDVLLSLLGTFRYKSKYPSGAPRQTPNTSTGSVLFRETGKRLGGKFLQYWQTHGGLAQQGYPISDEFMERSALNGIEYRVQYFERAVFEYHPENPPPHDVLLSQLGTFRYWEKYGTVATLTPSPTPRHSTPIPRRSTPTPRRPTPTEVYIPQPPPTPTRSRPTPTSVYLPQPPPTPTRPRPTPTEVYLPPLLPQRPTPTRVYLPPMLPSPPLPTPTEVYVPPRSPYR
jgi:hypothetical protein